MLARAHARKLLDECFITSPENLDLEKIAAHKNVFIEVDSFNTHLGRIHRAENYGLIKVNSSIKDKGQKNFTIAHELGHFISEHNKQIQGCTAADLMAFKSKKELERDANIFAAELLMRDEWVWNFTRKRIPGTELIKDMAEYFNTGLLSAAIRYAETGKHPAAVILSKEGKVAWSTINKDFQFQWLKPGYPVNGNSYADNYYKDGSMDTDKNKILADAWFLDDKFYRRDYYLNEQNIYLTAYNSVLTILWED